MSDPNEPYDQLSSKLIEFFIQTTVLECTTESLVKGNETLKEEIKVVKERNVPFWGYLHPKMVLIMKL